MRSSKYFTKQPYRWIEYTVGSNRANAGIATRARSELKADSSDTPLPYRMGYSHSIVAGGLSLVIVLYRRIYRQKSAAFAGTKDELGLRGAVRQSL